MNRYSLLPLLSLLFLTACDSSNIHESTEVKAFVISPQKSVCFGLNQRSCLQISEIDSQQVTNLYESIEGYDYQWGVGDLITVEITTTSNPAADSSSKSYVLQSVDETSYDPIGIEYTYQNVEIFNQTISVEGDQYRFLGDDIVCEPTDCDAIMQIADLGAIVNLTFTLNEHGVIELTNWD